jgi:hypothetical protein
LKILTKPTIFALSALRNFKKVLEFEQASNHTIWTLIKKSSSNVGEELNSEPCIGMEFKSVEKVREFYNSFAKRLGFGVRVQFVQQNQKKLSWYVVMKVNIR